MLRDAHRDGKNTAWDSLHAAVFGSYRAPAPTSEPTTTPFGCKSLDACLITTSMLIRPSALIKTENCNYCILNSKLCREGWEWNGSSTGTGGDVQNFHPRAGLYYEY